MKDSVFQNFKNFFAPNPRTSSLSFDLKEPLFKNIISFTQTEHQTTVSQPSTNIPEKEVDSSLKKKAEVQTLLDSHALIQNYLVKGEIIVLSQNRYLSYKTGKKNYEKALFILTNYKVCLRPLRGYEFYFFPIGKIDRIQKHIAHPTNQRICKLLFYLKDGRKFKFKIDNEQIWNKIYESIERLAFVSSKQQFFAFQHCQFNKELELKYHGWKVYNPIREFERMGIKLMAHTEQKITNFTSDFKVLNNENGKLCETYPPILVVPSRIQFESLVKCAKFRSKERLPAMSFAFQYEKGKFACVYRSSQSKVGVQGSRSAEDQLMLEMIGNPKYNPHLKSDVEKKKNCHIYDARGYLAALGNKIQGKGFEMIENYENCDFSFLNIPNIHAVREAYNKALEACYGDDSQFYILLADSKWYNYVFLILSGALEMSQTLVKGISSLVHCSDGWDRTAQLCALTSIILDPYYRTIEGFEILIEKDWIYFGHQFSKRLGQGVNDPGGEDKSQIFLQYLDCITQIMHQFPHQFQFNYSLIQEVGEQAYSHLYGNFLCNCHIELEKNRVKEKTISLWSKIEEDKKKYLNKFYVPTNAKLLDLDVSIKAMRVWKEHFLKFVEGFETVYSATSIRLSASNLKQMHKKISWKEESEDEEDEMFSILEGIEEEGWRE